MNNYVAFAYRWAQADQVKMGRVCRIIKGRKIAIGSLVTPMRNPRLTTFGYVVDVNVEGIADEGHLVGNVPIQNLRVAQPELYCEPPFFCGGCREHDDKPSFEGLIWKDWLDLPLCSECYFKHSVASKRLPDLRKDWKPLWRSVEDQQNGEEMFLRAIFDEPNEAVNWLVYADWVEDNPSSDYDMDQALAQQIRIMVGHKKIKYRKKDLVVSAWTCDKVSNDQVTYRSVVTGFPLDGLLFDSIQIEVGVIANLLMYARPQFLTLKGGKPTNEEIPPRLVRLLRPIGIKKLFELKAKALV